MHACVTQTTSTAAAAAAGEAASEPLSSWPCQYTPWPSRPLSSLLSSSSSSSERLVVALDMSGSRTPICGCGSSGVTRGPGGGGRAGGPGSGSHSEGAKEQHAPPQCCSGFTKACCCVLLRARPEGPGTINRRGGRRARCGQPYPRRTSCMSLRLLAPYCRSRKSEAAR